MPRSIFRLQPVADQPTAVLASSFCRRLLSSIFLFCAFSVAGFSLDAWAGSAPWHGNAGDLWSDKANWLSVISDPPGTGDTASFVSTAPAVSHHTTINVSVGLRIATILFDTANAAPYTIGAGGVGAQTITFDNTGAVKVNSTVVNDQLFNANINLSTAVIGTTTFTNSSLTNSLIFAGTIQGGSGGIPGTKYVNTAGAGSIDFTNTITKGGASVLNLTNTGAGTMTLSGVATSSVGTLRATANGFAIIDGQTVTVANLSTYGASGANGKFELKSGSVSFDGGLTTSTSAGVGDVSDGTLIKISGGSFHASSVTLHRTQIFAGLQTSPAITSGLIVSGGTADISGVLSLAGSNSSSSGLVSGGALAVGGEIQIGNSGTANGRYNVFQVSGGSFTSTDTANGIVLARSSTAANNGELLLTGGITKAEKISFGTSATAPGSTGALLLDGGALYLGRGGIVQGSAAGYTSTINLTGGTLGSYAIWSSSLPMNLNGPGVTIKAADASGISNNITLSGILSGSNGFTKTGGGTLVLAGANTYSGGTTVSSGVLRIENAKAVQISTLSLVANGALTFGTDITTATFGALSGTSSFALANTAGNSIALTLGNNNSSSATYSGQLSGPGSLTKVGTGTQILGTGNSYAGATNVSGGTLQTNGSNASTKNLLGVGPLNLSNGGRVRFNSTSGATFNNALDVGSGGGQLSFSANSTLSASAITGNGPLTLSVDNGATLTVNSFNAWNGRISVTTGGADAFLRLASGFDNTSARNAEVDLGPGVQLTRNSGTNGTIMTALGTLSGSAGSRIGKSSAGEGTFVFSIGARNEDATFAGTMEDGGTQTALTKVGNGTQIFSGINTYTGATTVSGGVLLVDGAIGGSATTVESGGTLGGTGSAGDITLNPGGSMIAGSTNHDFAANSLTWNGEAGGAFSQMKLELSTVDNSSDQLTLRTTLTKGTGSDFIFDFQNGGAASYSYLLFSFASQSGFNPSDFTYRNLAPGLTGSFALQDNALVFSVVPEPASLPFLISGAALLLGPRPGRRRAARRSAFAPQLPPEPPMLSTQKRSQKRSFEAA